MQALSSSVPANAHSPAVIQTQCWSHPGAYLGAISVQEVVDVKD